MGKPTGFLEFPRVDAGKREPAVRLRDHLEIPAALAGDELRRQGARCMDCGVPFCHQGCPLGNLIPEWNDLAWRDRWDEALIALHATNNFPEFTGRLCPAPCEGACVLGINADPVTIKQIEVAIIDRAFASGAVRPEPPPRLTGRRVAVVGSGPAGLAAAQQLRRAGHEVTVFERADRIGGLLRYGIPDFKLDKQVLQRRLDLMAEEGVKFRPGAEVGVNVPVEELRADYNVILLAGGAAQPRDLAVPGRDLAGVRFAMRFLAQYNRRVAGDHVAPEEEIVAAGKNVVVLGGGDTGSDCIGTAARQGARRVTQIELLPRPPETRAQGNPWPQWPAVFRTSTSHDEAAALAASRREPAATLAREFSVLTKAIEGENGRAKRLRAVRLDWTGKDAAGRPAMREVPGSEFVVDADLVLLAMGFLGPEKSPMLEALGVALDERGNVKTDAHMLTSAPGVYAAGDARRGQSLVVWAIAEGRRAAHFIDKGLMKATLLPR
ncbi:MAG: glutamate synthase subunit beta [Planctomycetes bacterium]|nr:glutamate synthase subunit beta [Planctomycetota bacterium]